MEKGRPAYTYVRQIDFNHQGKKVLVQKPQHSKEYMDLSRLWIEDNMYKIASARTSHKPLKAIIGVSSVNIH